MNTEQQTPPAVVLSTALLGTAYALFTPDGELVRCGETLDKATNYLVEDMSTEFWNALFGASPSTRQRIFEDHGWSVQKVGLIPNALGNRLPATGAAKEGEEG
jgi:hypothetical protein